ncbi:MAG: hypothetical protein Q9161_003720 [Pseudevernia consocians]
MSTLPLITFKAGICEFDTSSSTPKIIPKPTPGYLYLYEEDELVHFCWRPRSAPMSQPELDLVMVPSDGNFVPYYDKETRSSSTPKSPTTGRVFVLKFQSSSTRHLFWLQSKAQHPQGDRAWFSPRDEKIGQMVDRLLQGDEVNVQEEYANFSNDQGGDGDDEAMEDAGPASHGDIQGNIGSGDPFMGDPGNEGEESREGGADGGRAAASNDAAIAVQNFLRSMQGNQALSNQPSQPQGKIFTTLPDLLPSSTTIPVIDSADSAFIDNLLSHIPPVLLLLSQEADDISTVIPNSETATAAIDALSLIQKKRILRKVLRSPQFSQSLGSLTTALRDGGVPSISEALMIPVENGGFIRRGGVPLGGGEAVEAFLKGVKASVEKKDEIEEGRMDTV